MSNTSDTDSQKTTCWTREGQNKLFEPSQDKTFNKTRVTSKDLNQPVLPSSMARALVYPALDSQEAVEGSCDRRRFWSDFQAHAIGEDSDQTSRRMRSAKTLIRLPGSCDRRRLWSDFQAHAISEDSHQTSRHMRSAKTLIRLPGSCDRRRLWSDYQRMRSAKTLIRLRGCAGWSESSLFARLIVGFVVRWIICEKQKISVPC